MHELTRIRRAFAPSMLPFGLGAGLSGSYAAAHPALAASRLGPAGRSGGGALRSAAPASPRILVVDDNVKIHEDIRKLLVPSAPSDELGALEAELFGAGRPRDSSPGFELDFADRGEVAAELVARSLDRGALYAVAFVDVRMPGWDGVRTATELWRLDARIQIVFCTAYSDYAWEDFATKLRATDSFIVLKKPFDPIEVRQLAHAMSAKWALERERESREAVLERQVRERTSELAATNARLEREMESRAQAEKALRRAHKLEALGRLAAGIGHEINNPLTYVAGNVTFAIDRLRALSELAPSAEIEELLDALGEAADGAERIRRIVEEIRTFTRASEAAVTSAELQASLEAAERTVASSTRLHARFEHALADVPAVFADRRRIEQVLVNVLMNAAQALSAEKVHTNVIRVTTRAPSATHVEIEIADDGHGIDEADLEKVFDPFFTRRPQGQGTGLGLWICKTLVEGFGGTIAIESAKGVGTTVRIRLRTTSEAATDAALEGDAS
jgi:signal transduction histidine kinase